MVEALGRMIARAHKKGVIEGFKVGREEVLISHLQLVEDTVVFLRDSVEQARWLRGILMCFEAYSGLAVNLCKSMVFPVGNASNVEALAECLGCSGGVLPPKYLGLPLGAPYRCKSLWDLVIERFSRKLLGLKVKFLSGGQGR